MIPFQCGRSRGRRVQRPSDQMVKEIVSIGSAKSVENSLRDLMDEKFFSKRM